MYLQTVALKDVRCYALHGYYPEEQLIGCVFMVDITVTFDAHADTENLERTVNYEVLNQIILKEMKNTQKLLETVVKNMIEAVKENYPFIKSAEVGIKKMNPPMPGQIGHSYVALQYQV